MKAIRTSHAFVFVAGVLAACGAATFVGDAAVAQKAEASKRHVKSSDDERLFMLNALWFKPDGGAEKYNEYLQAAGPFVAKHGGKSAGAYVPEVNIIGKFDADLVFFVEWPNEKAFTQFIQDPGYRAVSHLRQEAIRDSLLIRCKKKQLSKTGETGTASRTSSSLPGRPVPKTDRL
jgi:uncharacterized protein (DUF1330 family)